MADGEIVIRDKDKQQQDIADLSRDTENAHQALENNFDKDKIRDQLETQTQAVALGTQAMDAWRTSKLDDEKAKIRAEMEANGELKGLSDEQINAKIEKSEQYKKVDEKYGVGSEFWRNGTALTGLLAGVLGGNASSGMAAGAAPYVAGLIKDVADGHPAARIALHTLASAVLVKAQGGNSAAGAAGGFIAAASSEALAQAFYGKSADKLSPDEKTVISNLVTALGAVGGSVAGGSSQGIGSGANAARVEVENNSMSTNQLSGFAQRARTCTGDGCETVIRDMITLNAEQQVELAELCTTDPKQCQAKFGYLVEQWPAFDAMIKHMAADGTLPDDFRDALTPMYAQGLEAEGILASSVWTERFEAMGANKEIALAMATTLPLLISGAKGAKGSKNTTTGNEYKISNGSDRVIAKAALEHPIVQSRINLKTGDSESGWVHVQNRHFSGKANASQFTISESEAKAILGSHSASQVPIGNTRSSFNKVTRQTDTLYERVIVLDKSIGIDKFTGKPTNTITVLTDKKGNLVTATPGRIK